MLDLIRQVKELWKDRRSELEDAGKQIKSALESMGKSESGSELGKQALDEAYERLVSDFDERNGGFGSAPKFPSPNNLMFLLRYWTRSKQKLAITMVDKTLRAMRQGGVFDQIGYGFHRYSTDTEWLVPHFEKMLYDQAMLAIAYMETYQATGTEDFKRTAEEILEYVLRDMISPEGGFLSAEDADSEDEEGKFYVWTEDEIRAVLHVEDADLAVKVFDVEKQGNFVNEATRIRNGKNILHLSKPLEQMASEMGMRPGKLLDRVNKVREMLFIAREKRVRPMKDDKVLADWNGLMIAALARAAQVFDEERYLQAAIKAADFILEKMSKENGRLCHRLVKGEARVDGFLDDYAFLVLGLIDVYEASFELKYLRSALELTGVMIEEFWDKDAHGFYYTAEDAEEVIARRKETYDGAVPSGNSVAMLNLLRLARLTASPAYEEMAARIGRAFSSKVMNAPEAHAFMLLAVDFAVGPAYEVVLVGNLHDNDALNMVKALRTHFIPNMVVLYKPEGEVDQEMLTILKRVSVYGMINRRATAFVCQNQRCLQPTDDVEKLLDSLGVTHRKQRSG
jgi:hypothetical protein